MAIRQNIRGLTAADLSALRRAFRQAMAINDERGYEYFASLHGLPLPIDCQHGNLLFLPWHRAYLYFMELALQDLEPGAALPWWDWSSDISHREGLPPAFGAAMADGEANPLFDAAIGWTPALVRNVRRQIPGVLTSSTPPRTRRDPDAPDELPRRATVESVLAAPTFEDFSMRMENVHNAVHVWVGGSMSAVPAAGYDPIFWAHHTMVDRLWRLWQMAHPGMDPGAELLDTILTPFAMTVADTLNVNALGYDYAVEMTVWEA